MAVVCLFWNRWFLTARESSCKFAVKTKAIL